MSADKKTYGLVEGSCVKNKLYFLLLFQLHKHNYDISEALKALVPTTGPMLCRDEMEDWSASEANLFEVSMLSNFFLRR
jgi:hypothetical protein